MATKRKLSKRKQTKRRHRRASTIHSEMGKIMEPITIKNTGDIMHAIKRIIAGPLTMIVVMADWCGHCQTLKPKYQNIMANSNHTIQNVALDDTMVRSFNKALLQEIPNAEEVNVEGYPSLLLLDNNGKMKSAVPNDTTIIKSTTENLGKSTTLTNNKNSRSVQPPVSRNSGLNEVIVENEEEEEKEEEEEANNSGLPNNQNKPSLPPVNQSRTVSKSPPVIQVNTSKGYVPSRTNNSIVLPPSPETEVEVTSDGTIRESRTPAEEAALIQQGGSLYGSIASAAYKLAPPAVLMAAATAMMKRRKGKGKGKRTKKNRRV